MLLLLLVCLMKLVDMSAINRPRRYGGSKENRVQNGQQQQLTPQQYQQLRLYQHQQRQLQRIYQQQQQQQYQHQQNMLMQQQCQNHHHQQKQQQQQQQHQILQKQKQHSATQKSFGPNNSVGKGTKPLRGMTEYPSNENQKSRLPQLNHISPLHHSRHQQKRPLTSPNTAFNYDFTNYNLQTYQNCNETSLSGEYDDLTEENLKKNVQIVLNNLDRYNNALRSIILNEQSNLNWNNNVSMANLISSPESDYNSNPPHHPFGYLNCSIASSHDFTHDNSDYQWFLDYGYRDGVAHQSVLSSLSASYIGIGELSYYEDLARNIDANLAEVDMESFRAEDIHSLLTNIPSLCKEKRRQEQNELDNSICKSELLFSPVRESHISVDSLDLDSYPDDGDIILTCKANKDNYTIAFEGSALYSDESFYAEPGDPNLKVKQNYINLHSNLDDIVKRKSLEVSMSRSDHAFTTWSKLKKSSTSQLQRYPSGNNNTSVNITTRHAPHCIVRKSSSLPNLRLRKENSRQLNVSQAISSSTVDSFRKSRNLLPMCQMPISSTSGSESPVQNSSMHSTESSSKQNQPAFNLVKLFIKQKSSSSDTCMDVSSGCWPSDASSSLEQRMRKKSMNDSGKGSALSRHDEEEDGVESSYQLDSLDICEQRNTTKETTPKKVRNDLYREVFESSAHRNNFKESNMNNRNQPLKNPHLLNLTFQNNYNNNNNSMERDNSSKDCSNKSLSDTSRTSENLTQVFCNNQSHHDNRMKIPVDMIARSIQTSMLLKDKFRVVPPSFLAQLNKLGEEKRAPVYVIYPNYALPDLGFVKNNPSDVILSPLGYKEDFKSKKRPTSFTSSEEDALKNNEYKHVMDWKSLVTLLPVEYRRRLKHIPEADVDLDPLCSQRPLFCMTPPLRRNAKTTCDCASYLQTTCTSSSGSSQPPSSGYRGSSTLLTDSEFDTNAVTTTAPVSNPQTGDPMTNMYVYQYENTRMENEVVDRPPPSGRVPRGILRRNTRSARTKRNSMFEEGNSPSSIKNLEKRRSLQEPYYISENHNIIEDYLAEIEENHSKQYYRDLHDNLKFNKTNENYLTELNEIDKRSKGGLDLDARARAENFLSSVPKSELKYYVEIANILESMDDGSERYDRAKLKNEVSRALSQKKVSFNQPAVNPNLLHTHGGQNQKFSTPPNSPNISMAALRLHNNQRVAERKEISSAEREKLDKISSNRFKRLQIQWELLSKDSSVLLKDLAREKETKSGGSTPTSTGSQRSRIPRPVSYPASKTPADQSAKALRSPSRLVPPKKYNVPPVASTITSPPAATTGNIRSRTPSKLHTTPKKTVSSRPAATRTR